MKIINDRSKVPSSFASTEKERKPKKKRALSRHAREWRNPENKLVVCTHGTHYDVVIRAARMVGYIDRRADPCFNRNHHYVDHSQHNVVSQRSEQMQQARGESDNTPIPKHIPAMPVSPDEFDVFWYDLSIQPETLTKLKPYQRISQWPGIQVIAHKNRLGQNLMLMRKEFPEHYDFFPVTYVLPYEMNHF